MMMMEQTPAKMYLKGCVGEDNRFDYLYHFDRNTILIGEEAQIQVTRDSLLLLVPLIGRVNYTDSTGRSANAEAGQVLYTGASGGTILRIENVCWDTPVVFLHVFLEIDAINITELNIIDVDILSAANTLLPVADLAWLGSYGGRKEGTMHVPGAAQSVFAYVIQGAFEVENRLLETNEAVGIFSTHRVDFEALSENAIILLVRANKRSEPARDAGRFLGALTKNR